MTVKVRQDAKGKWWVRIDYHQRRVSRLFPSQERAEEVAEKLRVQLDLYGDRALEMIRRAPVKKTVPVPTVRQYAERWLAELSHRQLKLTTLCLYTGNIRNHVLPAFGDLPITDVDYAALKEWILSKVETYAKGTIHMMVTTFRAMLLEAEREGLIQSCPVKGLSTFYRQANRDRAIQRADVYQLDELYRIEDVLLGQRAKFEPDAYELFLCLSRTGMRVGEVVGLQPDDLDLEAGTIEIQRNVPASHGKVEQTTKGKAGRRTVDMGQELKWALRLLLGRRRVDSMTKGVDLSPWLFPGRTGAIRLYKFIRADWERAQRLAKVRVRSPHSLRHTYASISLAAGEDLAYVSKQLGHANPGITLTVYTHFLRRTGAKGTSALDRRTNENSASLSKKN
jgi:integrase